MFQGDEDEVVPPDQAEAIVAALREKGVPHAYLLFPGEQHGFRKAENIRAALDGELSFYAQVWGFDLPAEEGIAPIEVVARRGQPLNGSRPESWPRPATAAAVGRAGRRTSRRAAMSSSCGRTATASSPSIRGTAAGSSGAGPQRQERDGDLPLLDREGGERIGRDEVAEPGGLADDDRLAAPDHPRDAVLEPPHDGVQPRRSHVERQVAGRQMGHGGPASGGIDQPEEDVAVQALPAEHHVAHQPDVPHRPGAASYTSRTVGMIIGRRR